MLVTSNASGNYASVLAASFPFLTGITGSGYVGVNDGWTDLKGSSKCGSSACPDYTMYLCLSNDRKDKLLDKTLAYIPILR
jgi:glucoamylase